MVQIANPNGNFPTVNGSLPCEGTKTLPINFDFTTTNAYQVDLTSLQQQNTFTTLQTVWIDNSQNNSFLEIICGTTSQLIFAPPRSQGFYAMLLPVPFKFTVQSSGGIAVQCIFLNYYIPPQVWNVGTVSAGGLPQIDVPALDAIIVNGGMNVNTSPATLTALTDNSGTITAGGTRQSLFAANAARKRWILSNPSTATEILQFSIGTNTAGLIDLLPGQTWSEDGATVVGDQIFVVAATTGHAFTAYSK